MDHRGHAGGNEHAFEQVEVGIGLQRLQQRHDFGQVAQRAQAAGHQVQAVEDQRETHAGERYVLDLFALGEAIDQREHAGQDQSERTERQGDQSVAKRGADIGAHDDADRRPQGDDAGIDQADDHDAHRGRRLDDASDQRSRQHALDRRSRRLGEKGAHPVDRERLDAVCHEVQTEHENAQSADHRHEDVLEDIYVHFTQSPTSRHCDATRSSVAARMAAPSSAGVHSQFPTGACLAQYCLDLVDERFRQRHIAECSGVARALREGQPEKVMHAAIAMLRTPRDLDDREHRGADRIGGIAVAIGQGGEEVGRFSPGDGGGRRLHALRDPA